jgi:leucine dehydrogenase
MSNVNIFEQMNFDQHETVMFCNDKTTGLKAIIAIHNTVLGPALGGCRFYPYATDGDALTDALRLSKGMTYKASVAGLNLGGGKSVIIGDPKKLGYEALLRAFGRFVNSLNGKYITAEDVGTSVRFMDWVNSETDHVSGINTHLGGSGDPSPFTAHGTFCGIKAALKKVRGKDSFKGVKIAVEGIGNVGYYLCKELAENGAKLWVSDVNPEAVKRAVTEFKAIAVPCEKLYSLDVDVYAPCALGATINDKTLSQFKCSIIAGGANNQLKEEKKHGEALLKKDILYAPDFVINAGGLINVYTEVAGGGREYAWEKVERIYGTLLDIFDLAEKEDITTAVAANKIAEKRIREVATTKNIYSGR